MVLNRKITAVIVIMVLTCSSYSIYAIDLSSRAANWPPISSYEDMVLHELGFEISMMLKDLDYYKKRNDLKSSAYANEAYNRLSVLFIIYSERSGRPLEIVKEMYGNPSRY